MYSLGTLLVVTLVAVVIGLIIGSVLGQRTPGRGAQRDLEKHLQELESQQKDYQQEVTEHFTETAKLLNQLTSSYRDVHNHLARGAQELCGENASESLQLLPDPHGEPVRADIDPQAVQPPLDYAPRNPYQKGMLNEEFGIEKTSTNHAQIEQPSQ